MSRLLHTQKPHQNCTPVYLVFARVGNERICDCMNTVEIFPIEQLIIGKYFGDVRISDIAKLTQEMVSMPSYSPLYNGVTDFRGVNILATQDEMYEFTKSVIDDEVSLGTWCIICDAPMTTAFMIIFKSQLESRHPVEVISTVEAASNRLGIEIEKYLGIDEHKK